MSDDVEPSAGAKASAWVVGVLFAIPFGLKTNLWIYGPEHPLSFDVSWWVITAGLWAGIPPIAAYHLVNEIKAEADE